MQNKREFWNYDLHLEEIKNIIINIIERKDLNLSLTENYELNNLNYEISINKNGKENYLVIVCNDGRNLFIKLGLIGESNGDDICLVQCTYTYKAKHEDKEQKLEFISTPMRILGNFGLKYTDELNLVDVIKYDRYNEYNRLREIDSVNDERFVYNYFTAEGVFKYYCTITPDGYSINSGKDNFLVSDDYKLLKVNGQEVCDYEKIKEFNYEEELRKIKNILKQNCSTLNPLTISSLDELMIDFEKNVKTVELLQRFYEKGIIDTFKEIVRDYDKMSEFIANYTFTKEELLQFYDVIYVMFENSLEKDEDNNSEVKVLRK